MYKGGNMRTLQNDLKLFKKAVKAILKLEMDDAEKYAVCVSIIWNADIPDRIKDKCKEYVIDQL